MKKMGLDSDDNVRTIRPIVFVTLFPIDYGKNKANLY